MCLVFSRLNLKTKARGILCNLLQTFQKNNLWLIPRSYRNRLFGHWLITMEKPEVFGEKTKGGEDSRLTIWYVLLRCDWKFKEACLAVSIWVSVLGCE